MSPIVIGFAAVYATGIVYWLQKCFGDGFADGKEAIRASYLRAGGEEPTPKAMRWMLVPYSGFLLVASLLWPIASWINILGLGKKAEPRPKLATGGDSAKWCGEILNGPLCSCTLAPKHKDEHHHPKYGSWPNDAVPAEVRGSPDPFLAEIIRQAELGNVSSLFRVKLTLKDCVVEGEIVTEAQVRETYPGLLPPRAAGAPIEIMYVRTARDGRIAAVRLDEIHSFGSSRLPDPKGGFS
jgi:hypothetical protein